MKGNSQGCPAQVQCLSCSLAGSSGHWCLSLPDFPVVMCLHPPNITHGKLKGNISDPFSYGVSVSYGCDPGYSLVGNAFIKCTASGTWSQPLPQCKGVLGLSLLMLFRIRGGRTRAGLRRHAAKLIHTKMLGKKLHLQLGTWTKIEAVRSSAANTEFHPLVFFENHFYITAGGIDLLISNFSTLCCPWEEYGSAVTKQGEQSAGREYNRGNSERQF